MSRTRKHKRVRCPELPPSTAVGVRCEPDGTWRGTVVLPGGEMLRATGTDPLSLTAKLLRLGWGKLLETKGEDTDGC